MQITASAKVFIEDKRLTKHSNRKRALFRIRASVFARTRATTKKIMQSSICLYKRNVSALPSRHPFQHNFTQRCLSVRVSASDGHICVFLIWWWRPRSPLFDDQPYKPRTSFPSTRLIGTLYPNNQHTTFIYRYYKTHSSKIFIPAVPRLFIIRNRFSSPQTALHSSRLYVGASCTSYTWLKKSVH